MINYNQYFKFLSGLILFAITLFEVADIVDNRFGVEGHYTLLIVAIVSVFFVGTVKEDKFFFFRSGHYVPCEDLIKEHINWLGTHLNQAE